MRYRAILAYDGTGYHGFQRQANALTVQEMVEQSLFQISGHRTGITGAGRTDAGVHAAGQVIAFDLDWRHSTGDLRNALNAGLPGDIAALDVSEAAPGFHPRFDALSRTYAYRLYVATVRDPMRRWSAWHLADAPEPQIVQMAADGLIGTHDFSAFGTPPQGENSVRTIYRAEWVESPPGQHTFTIEANAFLYRMVRALVGALVAVGQGHMTTMDFQDILATRKRAQAGRLAPPYGLTLIAVTYPEETT